MAHSREGGTGPTERDRSRVQGLDLLRALAILGVLVMHVALWEATSRGYTPPALTEMLGFLGVELFFILSGFLIGRILIGLADAGPGPRDWAIFMTRRWMRTLPLYFLWLVLLLLVAPPALDRPHMAVLYVTFTQNLAWPTPQGWFPVTWSLTTEEWFYLLFSAAVLGLAALRVRGAVVIACAAFVVLPLAARFLLVPAGAPFDTGVRQVALFRLDAIAYGVLMAWAMSRMPAMLARRRNALFLLGCFFLFFPPDVLALSGDEALRDACAPVLLSLTAIGFALWVPASLDVRIVSPRLASAVRWLSERSYCLYIIHLSVIELVWNEAALLHVSVILCTPIALALSAGLAELSFRYFESPILRLRPRQQSLTVAGAETAANSIAIPLQPAG